MSIFPSAAEMRAIAGPIVADAAEQLGSRADLYELAPVRKLDGSTTRVPNLLVLNDVQIRLKELTAIEAQTVFGLDPQVTFKGSVPDRANVALEQDQVFNVVSGDFVGRSLQIKSLIEKQYTDSWLVGLVDYAGPI